MSQIAASSLNPLASAIPHALRSTMLRQDRGPSLCGFHFSRIREVAIVITVLSRQELVRVEARLEPGLTAASSCGTVWIALGSDRPGKHRVAVETKIGASTALARKVSANDKNCSL
jgi:hypothetical protein